MLCAAAPAIREDTRIVIDPTDIQKACAEKMEYLAKVWDGGEGKVGGGLGYTLCVATEKFTCVYCGQQRSSMAALVSAVCPRHPDGVNKGRHRAYEGADKSEYVCKYCGQKRQTVQALVSSPCPRHPDGVNKGKHSPAR